MFGLSFGRRPHIAPFAGRSVAACAVRFLAYTLVDCLRIPRRDRRFDSPIINMIPLRGEERALRVRRLALAMADNNALYAIRFPDGSLSLYIDEDYAIERGVDPATLTRVDIPRDMFVSGTIQEIREYVALYLESRHSGTA